LQTRFHIRRKVFALVVCLLFSTILWFLNDLSRVQTATVEIPVKFTGLPYDMVTVNSLPATMDATIEATGFDLLWSNYSGTRQTIEIPLRLEKGGVDPMRNYLFNINYYMPDITEALGPHYKIRRVFPDTFSIRFQKKFVKKVPVKINSDLQFVKEFGLSAPVIIRPDSVLISGTKENLLRVDSVFTKRVILKDIRKSYTGKAELEDLNGITYANNLVEVYMPVEQYTEKSIVVKIIPANVPIGYELNTIPDVCSLKVSVPLSLFNKIAADQFRIIAEFPAKTTSTNRIMLKVETQPSFTRLIKLDPVSVEYKIKQE